MRRSRLATRPSEAVDAERSSLSGEGGQGSAVVEERRARRFTGGCVAYPTDRVLGGGRLDAVPILEGRGGLVAAVERRRSGTRISSEVVVRLSVRRRLPERARLPRGGRARAGSLKSSVLASVVRQWEVALRWRHRRPGREIQPFLQEQHGYGEPRRSYSERETKGHEWAVDCGSPHFCQLVDPRPRRSEKVKAGVLNQYSARSAGRAL